METRSYIISLISDIVAQWVFQLIIIMNIQTVPWLILYIFKLQKNDCNYLHILCTFNHIITRIVTNYCRSREVKRVCLFIYFIIFYF